MPGKASVPDSWDDEGAANLTVKANWDDEDLPEEKKPEAPKPKGMISLSIFFSFLFLHPSI